MSYIQQVIEHYDGVFSGNKCCCPIHTEKTPSLQIYEDTESWHCFGECSMGGDAIEFIKTAIADNATWTVLNISGFLLSCSTIARDKSIEEG